MAEELATLSAVMSNAILERKPSPSIVRTVLSQAYDRMVEDVCTVLSLILQGIYSIHKSRFTKEVSKNQSRSHAVTPCVLPTAPAGTTPGSVSFSTL